MSEDQRELDRVFVSYARGEYVGRCRVCGWVSARPAPAAGLAERQAVKHYRAKHAGVSS